MHQQAKEDERNMLLIVFYIIVAIIATLIFLIHLKNRGISISITFHALFLIYYFVIPPLMLLLLNYTDWLHMNIIRFNFIAHTTEKQRYLSLLLAIIGYVIFIFVFRTNIFTKRAKTESADEQLYETQGLYTTLYKAGRLFAIIGIICFGVVIYELGGISAMLGIAGNLRGYNVDKSEYFSSIGAICLSMSGFIYSAAICLLSCLKKKRNVTIWLAVVLIFLLLYLLYNQGRGPIVLFTLCILYAFLKRKDIKDSRIISVFLIIAVFVFLSSGSLRTILRSVSSGQTTEVTLIENIESTLNDLSYPYANTLNVTHFIEKYGFRFFKDYVLWVPELLPSRLFSEIGIQLPEIQTMTSIVSYEYSRGAKNLGGVPVDFLTSGFFQGGILGLIGNSIIILCLLRKLESIVEAFPKECSAIKFWICATITWSAVISMDPCKLPLAYLHLFILIFVMRKQAIRMKRYKPTPMVGKL